MTEKELQALILRWAEAAPGIRLWRNTVAEAARHGNRTAKARIGSPDLEGWVDGWYLGVEVKNDKRAATDEQCRWLIDAQKAGGCCFVARSLEDVSAAIESFRLEKARGRR